MGSAVTRNRVKRRLRAAYRATLQVPGRDVLVKAGPGVETLSYQDLEKHLIQSVTRAEAAP